MSTNKLLLGVNIDHVATLRQQRHTIYPDPIEAGLIAEKAGADGITLHLREDRRHIQDADVIMLKKLLKAPMNLEMAVTPEMLKFACEVKPKNCCLVPERRAELTTEGGLDVVNYESQIFAACKQLQSAGIAVSLFIAPDLKQLEAAIRCQADMIEIHTGHFTDGISELEKMNELNRIKSTAQIAVSAGLQVNAGHGLNYDNVQTIAEISEITELNIGHSIIARAVFVGLPNAIKEMKELLLTARSN